MSGLHSVYRKLTSRSVTAVVRDGPRYVRQRAIRRAVTSYHRLQRHATEDRRRRHRDAAIDRLRDADAIHFLCHGNICRSPYAEQYARQRLDRHGGVDVTVTSAGLSVSSTTRAPADAVAAAEDRGVLLDSHRPQQADAPTLERADIVFVMDYRNYHNLTTRYPDCADRAFLLGLFDARGRGVPITDPYGDGPDAFETAYDRITRCIDSLHSAHG